MDINLLPWREEIIEYNKKVFTRLLVLTLIVSGLFLTFIYYLFFAKVSYATNYTQALESAKLNLVGNVSAYFTQQKLEKEVNARCLTLERLQYSRFESVYLLNELAKVVPKGVYLNTLSRDGGNVAITGSANSNLLISGMIQSIDATKTLKTISLKKVERREIKGATATDFDIQLSLSVPRGGAAEDKKPEGMQLQNPVKAIQELRDEKSAQIDNATKN